MSRKFYSISRLKGLFYGLVSIGIVATPVVAQIKPDLSVERGPALANGISALASDNYKQLVAGNGDASVM